MGKETDLWDDSALINAFDQAVNKYKAIHKGKINDTTTGGEISTNNEIEPSSTDRIQLHSESDVTKNDPSEAEAVLTIDSSAVLESQNSKCEPHISEEDCSQLLAQYYELEEKRQSVLQRLRQAGYWSDPHDPRIQENYGQAPVLPSCCVNPYESGLSALCPSFQDVGERREKGEEEEDDGGETDLTTVANAWYSAGFYTGRYLLEHSRKTRSQ